MGDEEEKQKFGATVNIDEFVAKLQERINAANEIGLNTANRSSQETDEIETHWNFGFYRSRRKRSKLENIADSATKAWQKDVREYMRHLTLRRTKIMIGLTLGIPVSYGIAAGLSFVSDLAKILVGGVFGLTAVGSAVYLYFRR